MEIREKLGITGPVLMLFGMIGMFYFDNPYLIHFCVGLYMTSALGCVFSLWISREYINDHTKLNKQIEHYLKQLNECDKYSKKLRDIVNKPENSYDCDKLRSELIEETNRFWNTLADNLKNKKETGAQ